MVLIAHPVSDTVIKKVYPYADRTMFIVERYVNGQPFGFHREYNKRLGELPVFTRSYDEQGKAWGMFPLASAPYSQKTGKLLKTCSSNRDSVYVRCPFDSTTIWYEGAFVSFRNSMFPLGTHRVYYESGKLHFELEYDTTGLPTGYGPTHGSRKEFSRTGHLLDAGTK